jgi:glycosyltransferase involved in cell wall biosynthesis
MPAKLTALITCKNERRNIRPCIESVQGIADEILVADSGSTDGTLDIVREIGGCRIIEREYVTAADFKNWAIPQARHEWILLLDADERVLPQLVNEVRTVLADPPTDVDGYWIGRRNHYLGYPIRHCGWNTDDVIRLFRRDVSRYETRWVHEEIDLPPRRVKRLTTPLDHFTTWSTGEYLEKLNRYANLGALNLRDETNRRSEIAMFLRLPTRFLQLYFLRLGFLDGIPGFQICVFTAFYSFLKQAKLWEMYHALEPSDPEIELQSQAELENVILDFTKAKRLREQPAAPKRHQLAA